MIDHAHAMPPPEWVDADQAATLMHCSRRQAQRILSDAPLDLLRTERRSRGRPLLRAHVSAHHRLYAAWDVAARNARDIAWGTDKPAARASTPDAPAPVALSAADAATAQLRAQAVAEYSTRCLAMTETQAAILTASEWRATPRRRDLSSAERIGRHTRDRSRSIVVGPFSVSTLRRWAGTFERSGRRIESLAPARKGRAGRDRIDVPEALLDLIHALAVSTARADIASAIARARTQWPGEWPRCSYATLLRRIRERDPAQSNATLGKRGIAAFRADHSPDIERDWSQARYNEEWQLDDITEDFYGHGADPRRILRPYAYAIIRASTREWIAAVATETPLTGQQVRPLVGIALADPRGGIPERIRFERGSVACDAYLQEVLESLGIQVARTSMDGGRVAPGAMPDRATGHFQGKGIVESNIRLHHNRNAYAAGQVGPDERNTAPARTETLKAYAAACARAGAPSVLPEPAQWRRQIFGALENHNDRPHGSLPRIVLEDGSVRHQTPNEAGAARRDQVSVMPSAFLPLFYSRGVSVPVTKNGILLNKASFGRFDPDLAQLQGTRVTAFACDDLPHAVYVEELGRCVDAFDAPAPGAEGALMAQKRGLEKTRRTQYEQLIERVRSGEIDSAAVLDATLVTRNPAPDRPVRQAEAPALARRVERLQTARAQHADARAAQAARFEFTSGAERPTSRRGLLAQADRLTAQAAIGRRPTTPADADPFDIFQEPRPAINTDTARRVHHQQEKP